MGNCVGGFRRRTTRIAPWKKKSRTIVICFIGVDGVGKTTIVKALQGEDLGSTLPTVGFSRAEFAIKKHHVIAYDLGGSSLIRGIWSTYYAEVHGIVYVADNTVTSSRLDENRQLIESLVENPDLMHKPILFLLNKKDLPDAIPELHFSETFGLHEMSRRNKADIRVEPICAIKGSGKEADELLLESMTWLTETVATNYAIIDRRVSAAIKALRKRQTQDRLERQHRLAQLSTFKDTPRRDTTSDPTTQIDSMTVDQYASTSIKNPTSTNNMIVVEGKSSPERSDTLIASKSLEDEKRQEPNFLTHTTSNFEKFAASQ